MAFTVYVLLFAFVFGMAAVASNPSPYFGALGLALVSCFGCGLLILFGSSFLSLVLLLIYLGGMLVVFGYSAAFSADRYPKDWSNWAVLVSFGGYLVAIYLLAQMAGEEWGWYVSSWVPADEQDARQSVLREESVGAGLLYAGGVIMLLISGSALLLALFVVFELTRRLLRGGGRPH